MTAYYLQGKGTKVTKFYSVKKTNTCAAGLLVQLSGRTLS